MATHICDDPAGWTSPSRQYQLDDGTFVVITVDEGPRGAVVEVIGEALKAMGAGNTQVILQPTAILPCTEDGAAENLTPLATYPPGTGHDDALAQYLSSKEG